MILLKEFPFQVYTLFLHLSVKHPISSQKRWNNWRYIFSNNRNVLLGIYIGQSLHKHTLHLMQKLLQWWWLTSSLWIIYLCIINLENLKLAKHITSVRFLTCDCSNFFPGHVFYFHDNTLQSPSFSLGVNYIYISLRTTASMSFSFLVKKRGKNNLGGFVTVDLQPTLYTVYDSYLLAKQKEVAFKSQSL